MTADSATKPRMVVIVAIVGIAIFQFSDRAITQESFGRCATVTVSPRSPPNPEIIHSSDGSHLARIEFQLANGMPRRSVQIFKLEMDRQYVLVGEVQVLDADHLPYHKFVSNDGRYVVLGKLVTFSANLDRVSIYDRFGKHAYVVTGKDVLTSDELAESKARYESSELCAPLDPWICWDTTPGINSENELELLDTLGHRVVVNLNSGEVRRGQTSHRPCMLFRN